MVKTIMKIDGMMCGMCEAHVNDAIRAAVSPKKVNSSHSKGITEIISESELDSAVLREAVEKDGYKVLDITSEPYEKKGLFGRK
ncbi:MULTISPECIES: heavy-metal-associated domain-containing protein [Ruminococcus]|jgi:copper chaperone CopZ|uniref:Copper chaperone CopZ n=1 Tax=Ruminococcus flavefaciens TaxID=1265 RepID=A0A315XZN1_RUMFL|nr:MULTISPECIES: ATPase P [Ruminococcus]MBQ6169945.1 ATPase P [Ruminococcus sp.]MBR3666772.1 ATPase P [Ruminococcus sp.]MBR6996948.1 ATPase P [Ruminococcus sp.]PWJ12972.1 copper chaperone CopZ [Ruminococcus flavefaciens]SSA48536.1 Copper chaperone CopZ [Ruminococcus flavefaciens]